MYMTTAIAVLVLSELCLAIRVPTIWNYGASEVQNEQQSEPSQEISENVKQKVIPAEYFVYTAQKPQFAVDIAQFHGVHNPKEHYKSYPVRPFTGKEKPDLGKHNIFDQNKEIFKPFQEFRKNEALKNPTAPASVSYEVFHPYKEEEPALQQIYKDPVLAKIRDDIRDSQYRLQNYENEAGKPNITKDEYLESLEQTDRNKSPQRNVPAPYEVYTPQRRPVYYRVPPKHNYRDQVLNQRFKHPWNQNYAKIRPVNYRPLKNHLQRLRQHHALKYDDERNEYPQLPLAQQYAEPLDGYDIYERGKQKYVQLRNNVDDSINKAVLQNRPTIYQKLEFQNNGDRTQSETSDDSDEDEEEFVPVKNYAQVRKTETTKHLPKEAAFDDAENFDEIRNAPRLREAIKSTKAQTVYTEEGYEDAAYDHAGEQKHASENEGHAGYLKEHEKSGGKYKIPSTSANYEDGNENAYRDQTMHGQKWKKVDKDDEENSESEDYGEDESEHSIEADIYKDISGERDKRENGAEDSFENDQDDETKTNPQHEVNKRETSFKVPEINLNSTFLNNDELAQISRLHLKPKNDSIKDKYPYYFTNLKNVHKHSPLRYAENLKLIPKKSKGGTEFYDSKSLFECPEVDDKVDALPEKLKKGGHPDSEDAEDSHNEKNSTKKGKADFDNVKEQPRLKGLGDKIDCFKAKYFGENPLDSPFFKEDVILNPEPVTAPNLAAYKLRPDELSTQESTVNNIFKVSDKLKDDTKMNVFDLLDNLKNAQIELQESLVKTNNDLRTSLLPQNLTTSDNTQIPHQYNVYSDVLDNIKNIIHKPILQDSIIESRKILNSNSNSTAHNNVSYNFFQNKNDVTKSPQITRKKRSTPFVYEPYKIIRDGQVQDSKKTTTTSNISPLIKQLQSSRVVDRVTKTLQEKEQPVKRNVATRTYKDIGRKDREKSSIKENEPLDASFVDVNIDQRRGEPRYELRPTNHKSQYTPVENKKAMSVEDYEAHSNKTEKKNNENITTTLASDKRKNQQQTYSRQRSRQRNPTVKPYFDVSQFLPNPTESQKSAASNTVSKVVKATTGNPDNENKRSSTSKEPLQIKLTHDYEDYDVAEEITTTSTTLKPTFRKRKTTTTTTAKPHEEDIEPELPKLRLITRFRNPPSSKNTEIKELTTEKRPVQVEDLEAPKYREKKKKSTKSTLVTDTKTYGDGEDDMRKEEIDALIGVQHDMDEYTPHYEKEADKKTSERYRVAPISSEEDDDEYDEDDDDDEYDEDEEDDDEEDDDDDEEEPEQVITTPEPTKRTLTRTTEAPVSTTEARSAKLELKPIVTKKTIEIHKELPVNKTSPHKTQFKQDIKEVEITKEMPTRIPQKRPQKNLEALELYKDERLPKEVNKLGDVEIFRQNLDFKKGPRHGGNYRSAKLIELQDSVESTPQPLHGGNLKVAKDAEASQSENTRLIELGDALTTRRMHGGNLKSISAAERSRNSDSRNAKLELESAHIPTREMQGGNLRSTQDKERRRGSGKNAKIIEFDDDRDDDDDSTSPMHGGNFKSYGNSRDDDGSLHGGSYRSAKLVKLDDKDAIKNKRKDVMNARSNAAKLLNSFAQAVPILTTTPPYILDPSKRMYYYVDA